MACRFSTTGAIRSSHDSAARSATMVSRVHPFCLILNGQGPERARFGSGLGWR